jgi:hypothetical protein
MVYGAGSVGLIIFSTVVASNHPQMAVFSFLFFRKKKKMKEKFEPIHPS